MIKMNSPFKYPLVKIAVLGSIAGMLAVACGGVSTPDAPAPEIPEQTSSIPVSPTNSQITGDTNLGREVVEGEVEVELEPPTVCRITQARVSDPEPPLNVRTQPNVETGQIIGTVENGRFLSVKDESNGWLQVSLQGGEDRIVGWVAQNRTESNCNIKNQRISFPENGGGIEIRDRHIGGGSHEYVFRASEGQTLTVKVIEGAMPFIFPPNDPNQREDLSGGGHYNSKENVTVELTATGDYLLLFDSNFRGYDYRVLVQVE